MRNRAIGILLLTVLAAAGAVVSTGAAGRADPAQDLQKIRHVVVIMQENRSFDHYFGTYPGAKGIPMRHGVPIACVPDPERGGCMRPFRDGSDLNRGGPHGPG